MLDVHLPKHRTPQQRSVSTPRDATNNRQHVSPKARNSTIPPSAPSRLHHHPYHLLVECPHHPAPILRSMPFHLPVILFCLHSGGEKRDLTDLSRKPYSLTRRLPGVCFPWLASHLTAPTPAAGADTAATVTLVSFRASIPRPDHIPSLPASDHHRVLCPPRQRSLPFEGFHNFSRVARGAPPSRRETARMRWGGCRLRGR